MTSRRFSPLMNKEFNIGDGNWGSNRKPIDRIILHTTVGTVESAISRFSTPNNEVSAHYIVGLDGVIYGGLEEFFVAYHADNYPMNQRSIGIEHADNNNYNGPRTPELYAASAKLVADICKYFSIPCDRTHILKHSEVSDEPTACPDALDVDRVVRDAASLISAAPDYKALYMQARPILYSANTPAVIVTKLKSIIL